MISVGFLLRTIGPYAIAGAVGFYAGTEWTHMTDVVPLQADLYESQVGLEICGANVDRLAERLTIASEQIYDLQQGCAVTVDRADDAADAVLVDCEAALSNDATSEEWNAWLNACSRPPR